LRRPGGSARRRNDALASSGTTMSPCELIFERKDAKTQRRKDSAKRTDTAPSNGAASAAGRWGGGALRARCVFASLH
jgi:hypothetical protein